jgi:hypothetical protein
MHFYNSLEHTLSLLSPLSSPVIAWQWLPTADVPLTLGSWTIPMAQLTSNSNSSRRLNCSSPLTDCSPTNSLHSTLLYSLTELGQSSHIASVDPHLLLHDTRCIHKIRVICKYCCCNTVVTMLCIHAELVGPLGRHRHNLQTIEPCLCIVLCIYNVQENWEAHHNWLTFVSFVRCMENMPWVIHW